MSTYSCEAAGIFRLDPSGPVHLCPPIVVTGASPDPERPAGQRLHLAWATRVDGEWKIATRYCMVDWSSSIPRGASPFDGIDDLYANGVPGRNREDPCYRRPLINRRALHFPDLGQNAAKEEADATA